MRNVLTFLMACIITSLSIFTYDTSAQQFDPKKTTDNMPDHKVTRGNIEISNDFLELRCKSDGSQVTIRDKKRGVVWRLDERTRCYRCEPKEKVKLLGPGNAVVLSPGVIRQDFNIGGEKVSFLWEMLEDGLNVSLSFEKGGKGLYSVALPGSFIPDNQSLTLALPISQGVLFDGRGKPFEKRVNYGGNVAFSMAMIGYQTEHAAMLVSIENQTDWRAIVGKRDDETIYSYSEQIASLGAMRYSRSARLFPTDPGITSLCKRYRSRVQERGKFKSWKEKIAERPVVERLFGTIVAFIGYQQGDFDYVAECKKLKRRGFDRALIYPVRFNVYSTDFKMGGDPPIYLSDEQILAIKQIGYDVSGWTWLTDAIDDGADRIKHAFSRNSAGNRIQGWKIDEYRFYRTCTAFQIELMKNAYTGLLKEMTWNMFDVTTNIGPVECYALDHPWHPGHALDRRGDLRFLKDLFSITTNGNRIIGSEGFADYVADSYDIAQTKLEPSYGKAPFWTVPMTMLVYHDSIIHDYWLVQNYNYHSSPGRVFKFGRRETGHPKDKAAMDALYGCPPNVFPFGRQYRYINRATRKTVSYTINFKDAAVQESLTAALPVAKLHRRIGKLEMLSHEFLSRDGAVQATTFSDSTRIIANFSEERRIVKDVGKIEAKSWKVIY